MDDAREPLHRTAEEVAEDEEFFRRYGPWAPLDRPKDDRDLAVAWPLLGAAAQGWLRDGIERLFPQHPWLQRMG